MVGTYNASAALSPGECSLMETTKRGTRHHSAAKHADGARPERIVLAVGISAHPPTLSRPRGAPLRYWGAISRAMPCGMLLDVTSCHRAPYLSHNVDCVSRRSLPDARPRALNATHIAIMINRGAQICTTRLCCPAVLFAPPVGALWRGASLQPLPPCCPLPTRQG